MFTKRRVCKHFILLYKTTHDMSKNNLGTETNLFTCVLYNFTSMTSDISDRGESEMPPTMTTVEVQPGETTILNCSSKDENHNFMLWELNGDKFITSNNPYNEGKYKFEVLSGKLYIRNIRPADAGIYTCISESISDGQLSVSKTSLIVDHEANTAMDAIKLMAIIISVLVIVTCLIVYFRLKRDWDKYDGRIIIPVDDIDDEEEDKDEVYNKTTTLKNPVPGPSRNTSSDHLYGIDNHGLDTDFNSVFEQIQIKTPERSLI